MKLATTPTVPTSTSKTNAVLNYYIPKQTAADLTSWKTLNFPATFKTTISSTFLETTGSYSVKAGLFGFDLTSFMAACKTAVSCDYTAYSHRYDGFSMGFYWTFPVTTLSASATAVNLSFCIQESHSCITEKLYNKSSSSWTTYAKAYSGVYFGTFSATLPSPLIGFNHANVKT